MEGRELPSLSGAMDYPVIDVILSGAPAAAGDDGGFGVEFWAALLSLVTALVVTAGPSLMNKIFPPDPTLADIARESTASVASTLDSTLDLVKKDIGSMRSEIVDNSKKLDKLVAAKKGK